MADKARPAVFLDRDGVLVIPEFRDGRSYAPRELENYAFYPEAADSLERLRGAGFLLVVVSNQPDVGAGLIAPETLEEMNRRLRDAVPLDSIEVCTHVSADNCDCRKPMPGMLTASAARLGIALDRSYMIGDRKSDVIAGQSAGCRTIFIDLEYTAELKPENADWTVKSLGEAVNCILSDLRESEKMHVTA